MSKSRRTHHIWTNDWPVLKPMSDAEKLKRVQKLPAPVPGVVVNVPLMLLPTYMQVYDIEPKAYERQVLTVKKQES